MCVYIYIYTHTKDPKPVKTALRRWWKKSGQWRFRRLLQGRVWLTPRDPGKLPSRVIVFAAMRKLQRDPLCIVSMDFGASGPRIRSARQG